jgi:hypothetical protein
MKGTGAFQSRIALNAARSLLGLGQLDQAREKAQSVLRSAKSSVEMKVRARILVGDVLYEKGRENPAALADAKATFQSARRDLEQARGAGKAEFAGAVELEISVAINLSNVLRQEALRLKGAEAAARRKEATELQDHALRAAHAAQLFRLAAVASANLGELHL